MAKEKTLFESISEKTKFGTKLPGNGNKKEERTIKELSYEQMIMASLASLVWGVKNIKESDKVKTLLGKTNVFECITGANSILNDISENIKTYNEKLFNTLDNTYKIELKLAEAFEYIAASGQQREELLREIVKSTKENNNVDTSKNIGNITIDFNSPDNLQKLIDMLNDTDETKYKSIISFFEQLSDIYIDTEKAKKSIDALNLIIGNEKDSNNSLATLFKKLNNISANNVNIKNIENINDFVNAIINILSIDIDKIKLSGLRFLVNITDKDTGDIALILKNVNEITKDLHIKPLITLNNFLDALIKIGNISKNERKQILSNIKFFNRYIDYILGNDKNNPGFIVKFINLVKDSNDEALKSLNSLSELLKILISFGDIKLSSLIKIHISLEYLKFIIDTTLLSDSNDTAKCGLISLLAKLDKKKITAAINKVKALDDLMTSINSFLNALDIKLLIKAFTTSVLLKVTLNIVISTLQDAVEKLNKINKIKNVDNINNAIAIINSLINIKASIYKSIATIKGLKLILNSIDIIKEIVEKFNEIDSKKLNDAIDGLESFNKIIAGSAAILLIGSTAMLFINIPLLFLFEITLGMFIAGTITALHFLSKIDFNKDIDNLEDFSKLVLISGGILILGGLFMQIIDIGDLFGFAIALGLFVAAISGIYLIFNNLKNEIESAEDFGKLIAISGLTLILGALIYSFINWEDLFGFALALSAFILAITVIYTIASKYIENEIEAAKDFAKLIAISALTLLIGGGLFMKYPKLFEYVGLFAITLVAFIGLIFLASKLLNNINSSLPLIIGLSLFVSISAMTLLIGGGLFMKYPDLWKHVGIFAITLVAFVAIIGFTAFILQKFKDEIIKGLPIMLGIVLILGVYTIIMGLIIGISALANLVGFENIWHTLGMMVAVIIVMGLLCAVAGAAIVYIGPGILGLGGIAVVLILMSFAFACLIGVVHLAKSIKEEDVTKAFNILGSAVWELVKNIGPKLMLLTAELPFILGGIGAVILISMALSGVALVIKMWSELKVPEYNGTGENAKPTGKYININQNSIKQLTSNIELVLTALGGAITSVYDKNKELFESDMWGFGDSPIGKVTKSFKLIGPMLSSIAVSIQKWANLKIPEYDANGKIKGYKSITNGDMKSASQNIKDVLTAIGQALVTTVKNNTEIFGDSLTKDSPAVNAAKAMKIMAETLNIAAESILAYATLTFPTYDKDGKLLPKDQWIRLTQTDIDKAVGKEGTKGTIQLVLESLGSALKTTVENSNIFKTNAPQKAAQAIKSMADALNTTVNTIKTISELNLDDIHKELDSNGKDNVFSKLLDIIKFTRDIYMLFSDENDKNMSVTGKVKHWYGDETGVKMSLAEYISEHNGDIEDANDGLKIFVDLINTVISNYKSLGDSFEKSEKQLEIFKNGTSSNIYTYTQGALRYTKQVISNISNEDFLDNLEELDDHYKDLENGFILFDNLITRILKTYVKISAYYKHINTNDFASLITLINSFNECATELNKINNGGFNFDIKTPNINFDSVYKNINNIEEALDIILKIGKNTETIEEENFNVLRDGILKIYGATNSITSTYGFLNHVKDLDRYIKIINSIKLNNLMHLKGLVESMNALSARLGNLDNLTDVLANKLTQVLYELVLQLRKAEATITNAHELQDKRRKLMEASLKEIRTIMDEPMKVEISQLSSTESRQLGDNSGGKINNIEAPNDSPSNTDTSETTITPELNNPEDSTVNNTKKSSNSKNNKESLEYKDILTLQQFKQYMENDFIQKFRWG